jgi:hypothetical protein
MNKLLRVITRVDTVGTFNAPSLEKLTKALRRFPSRNEDDTATLLFATADVLDEFVTEMTNLSAARDKAEQELGLLQGYIQAGDLAKEDSRPYLDLIEKAVASGGPPQVCTGNLLLREEM